MAHMNGFAKHGLDDEAFGEKSALAGLRTFDAFREFALDIYNGFRISSFCFMHLIIDFARMRLD
jgi:hypothetical protein